MQLYHGDLLAGLYCDSTEFEEWALIKREELRQDALGALRVLTAAYEARGDYGAASHSARRQLELEPWAEAAYRQLMRALALGGDRSAALAQYEACRLVIRKEFGIEPERETRALAEQIRAGEFGAVHLPVARSPVLPQPPTPFVGRERELAERAALMDGPDSRLVTLVGMGGIGKTRLALQAASLHLNLAERAPDGVYFVPLAGLGAPVELVPAIAAAINLPWQPGTDARTQLLSALSRKNLVLLLDNFEHLAPGVELLRAILQAAPRVSSCPPSGGRIETASTGVGRPGGSGAPRAGGGRLRAGAPPRDGHYAGAGISLALGGG